MASIQPFKIAVPDKNIERLKSKLSLTTFPQDVEYSDSWEYGVPLKDIKRLASYWQNGFDWRAAETKLNSELPQFTTTISVDGFGDIPIHFVHKRADKDKSIPLLFCHGWPGSFLEVSKILPLLTGSPSFGGPSFHVVAPSLPNFGFSGKVNKPGFAPPQYSEVCHKLMLQLGYDKYVTQGGDWGYIITRLMGKLYPEHVLASHFNFVRIHEKPAASSEAPAHILADLEKPHTESEKHGLERTQWFLKRGYGYNLEQSTRPHTLGFGLADSPVALLAWIYEKLHDWTDSYPWTDDEILTWIGIYAFSTAGADASVRIYYESFTQTPLNPVLKDANKYFEAVPIGVSMFPYDLVLPPTSWAHTLGPVVFAKRHESGGHFAAHERPEKLVDDLRETFGKIDRVVKALL